MERHEDTTLPRRMAAAVFKRLPEGGVLFSTETEVYFGIGEVGARIWELLPPATATVEEMVAVLAAKYRDVTAGQIRADVERFLGELLANELVTHDPPPPSGDQAIS